MAKVFEFLAGISERRPWLVVLAVALVTIFMAGGFPRISSDLSQESMMPEGYESIETWEDVSDKFGGMSFENALIVAEDVTSPDIARKMLELTPEKMVEDGFEEGEILKVDTYLDFLKKMPEMMGVEISIDDMPIDDPTLTSLLEFYLNPDPDSPALSNLAIVFGYELSGDMEDQLMTAFLDNRERIEGSISEDQTAALINFQMSPDLTQNEEVQLARELEDFVQREFGAIDDVDIYITGGASVEKDSQDFMRSETNKLMAAALLFIMLILYLTFRRLSDIALPLLIIMVAIGWLLGLMGWAGIPYTTMSVAIMPLMLGINIAYVIHVLSRYYEEREQGEDPLLSATTSIKTVGVAVFLTAVTTMIGFSSFLITDMPPMRDFGLLCVMGIAFSFLLTVTLLPAIIVLRDRRKKTEKLEAHLEKMRNRRRKARYGLIIDKTLVRMAMVSERHHWTITLVTVILVVFSIFAVFNLKTGADMRKMYPEDMPSVQASKVISEYFGPQEQDVILVEGDIYEPENLAAVLSMEDAIVYDSRNKPGEEGYFSRDGISSIADFIVMGSPEGTLPGTRAEIEAVVSELGKQMPLDSFVSEDEEGNVSAAMVMIRSEIPETEDITSIKTDILKENAKKTHDETGMRLRATGLTVLISDLLGNILPTQLKTSGIALLLCALILMLVFRSLAYGLAAISVVICGVIVEIIFLFAMGWSLDMMTVMISALVIGAGIDFGIHITHRFREEWHHGQKSLVESMKNTVLHVGRALVAAAFTTCGVFAILGISGMVPMQRFGISTAVALLGALLGAVLVLPSILAIIANLKKKKTAVPAAAAEVTPDTPEEE